MTTTDTDGWIEWHGGECPVAGDVIVNVRHTFRKWSGNHRADGVVWSHPKLVAYRIVQPAPVAQQELTDEQIIEMAHESGADFAFDVDGIATIRFARALLATQQPQASKWTINETKRKWLEEFQQMECVGYVMSDGKRRAVIERGRITWDERQASVSAQSEGEQS